MKEQVKKCPFCHRSAIGFGRRPKRLPDGTVDAVLVIEPCGCELKTSEGPIGSGLRSIKEHEKMS